jgi:DNA (cytosine-5)-methyltransferase 1
MKFGSVCSGIEAASVAWHQLGWQAKWLSEIEAFPSALLAHHYPNVPNFGDMTKFNEWKNDESTAINVLVGGTPCQSFSVAGLRKGLDDPRGNLMLTYLAIARKYKPKWLVWENVPGVLSSNGGNDFASLLRGMGELGYGFAYRVLDAQYFGVAQRRRRVFVIGCLGNWRNSAAVLFESHSLSGNIAPSRKERKDVAGPITAGISKGMRGTEGIESNWAVSVLNSKWWDGSEIANTLTKEGSNQRMPDKNNFNAILQPVNLNMAVNISDGSPSLSNVTATLDCWSAGGRGSSQQQAVIQEMSVRRLTPIECERLQGFPDNYTNIPWRKKLQTPDSPRYKSLGNSMAVPVMKWIGERIDKVNNL